MKENPTIENLVSYFRGRKLLSENDIWIFGMKCKNPKLIIDKASNWLVYFVVANDKEIRLYDLNRETLEYSGVFSVFHVKDIKKAKVKRTSLLFGEQYLFLKTNVNQIINTPAKFFNYNQSENINRFDSYFKQYF
ncbi:MAG: hypothetical protein KKH92_00295 [Firmicutes bacterium]|nr:hypothetical protein [Bacillota bacterium]